MNNPDQASQSTHQPEFTRAPQSMTIQPDTVGITRRIKSGANNFYWIAALSVINSLVLQFGGNSFFVVGMAATLFVDFITLGMAEEFPDMGLILKVVGIAISLVASGIVAMFGLFANRGKRWAFLVGMLLYAIDALIMLALREWMGLLFHGLFLYGLYTGLRALNELEKTVRAVPQKNTDFPTDIGT